MALAPQAKADKPASTSIVKVEDAPVLPPSTPVPAPRAVAAKPQAVVSAGVNKVEHY